MDFLKEWITNIVLFILFATVIDMLLPDSSMQKYTKMVTGLLLIAIVLSPVLKLISKDFETTLASIPNLKLVEEKNTENLIEMKKKEIQASQHAYILEQMAVQLKKDAEEELMAQHGLVIANIDLLVDEQAQKPFPENVNKITVQLKQHQELEEVVEVVEKVEIDTQEPISADYTDQQQKVISLLSEKWDVEQKTIEVLIEGGNT